MGYSRRTLNYQERIEISNPIHMMSMVDPIAIGVETLMIYSGCSLEKDFTKFICMNPCLVLYITFNQVDSCHGCVCGPLTWDTKDSLWMDDRVLIMTYAYLCLYPPQYIGLIYVTLYLLSSLSLLVKSFEEEIQPSEDRVDTATG